MKKLSVLILFLTLSFCLKAQTYNGSGGLIPDDGSSISFNIPVTGLVPSVLDTLHGLALVKVNLLHPYDSDLQFSIVSPQGDRVLLTYANGWDGDNYLNTRFTDTAAMYITQGAPPFNGYFKPQEKLGNLNDGRNGNGIWKLEILDMYAYADQGTLLNWSITFGDHPTGPFLFTGSNLPLVLINTNGQEIPDDPKIQVEMKIIDNGYGNVNHINDPPSFDGFAGIEIRGSSSQMFPKKSYGFETWDENGEEVKVSLFGMPEETDWILNANYTDKTLMRNALAYQTFRNLDHYATRYQYVEVMINGMYKGVYVFSEKIKRDGDRVNIAKLEPDENSGDGVTGGYIFKIDKATGGGGDGWTSAYPPPYHDYGQTIFFQYEYPKADEITANQKTYLQNYVNTFENVLSGPNFDDPEQGFRSFADEGTFIDYLIVNEISKNVDGYRLSTYIHKELESLGGKLRMGPVWDYDIAFHNSNYCDGPEYTGWAFQFPCHDDYWQIPFWWERMLEDQYFDNNLKCRWMEKRLTVLSNNYFDQYIDSIAGLLNEAQQRNFSVWPILGVYVWPNPEPIPLTYAAEVNSLKDWMHNRLSWLDSHMPGECNSVGISTKEIGIQKIKLYPNPASQHLFADLPYETSRLPEVEVTNTLGQQVKPKVSLQTTGGISTLFIRLDDLGPGLWSVRIKAGQQISQGTFLKLR